MTQIGFIGLGDMGSRMVERLLDAGYDVAGHNRTKSRATALIEQGMAWKDTPKEVAADADIVFTNVAHDAALRAVSFGNDGLLAGLKSGSVYIDMSTVNPQLTLELAEEAKTRGAAMLDAPVSGSKLTLEQGKLTIMVGGEESVLDRVRDVLLAIGPTVMYIGANGQAMALKLAININIATQILTMAEGVLLAEKYGVPRKLSVDVMLASAMASPGIKYRGPFLAEMPEEAWFDVNMMQKDILLALDTAEKVGATMPSTRLMNDVLDKAREMGIADQDFAIIYKVLEQMS